MIDIAALRAAAKKASPGPWVAHFHGVTTPGALASGLRRSTICEVSCTVGKTELETLNAIHIAACSPEVILALLDVVEAARTFQRGNLTPAGVIPELDALRSSLAPFSPDGVVKRP
jgi:hypothetical protein